MFRTIHSNDIDYGNEVEGEVTATAKTMFAMTTLRTTGTTRSTRTSDEDDGDEADDQDEDVAFSDASHR